MDLEIRHLKVLLAIADHGSVSKAAAALRLSQPSLSAQLKRIERLIGAQLFERARTGVVPTAHGKAVLAKARVVLTEMAELRVLDVDTPDLGTSVELRLGGTPGSLLPAAIQQLMLLHPQGMSVRAHTEASMLTLLRMVSDHKLDAAFVSQLGGYEIPTPIGVRRSVLVEVEPLFVGVAADHPLAAEEVVELSDLAGQLWLVDPSDDLGGTTYLAQACRDAGFELRVGSEVSDGVTARAFVSGGQYVALFQATAHEGGGVVVRPLAGDPLVQRRDLAWTDSCPVDHELIRRAALDAYLGLVDHNPSFYRWWTERGGRVNS